MWKYTRPRVAMLNAGKVLADHARVEDDGGVRAALIGLEEVDDRVAPGLLLPVAGEAHIDRQIACLRERSRARQQHVELALVVGDAPTVESIAPDLRLERRRFPEVERIGWLHVEVPVAEHRGRRVCVARCANLAHGQRLAVPVDDLTGPAGSADQIADPFARARPRPRRAPGRR